MSYALMITCLTDKELSRGDRKLKVTNKVMTKRLQRLKRGKYLLSILVVMLDFAKTTLRAFPIAEFPDNRITQVFYEGFWVAFGG